MKITSIIGIILIIGAVIGLILWSSGLLGGKIITASEFSNAQSVGMYNPGDTIQVTGVISEIMLNTPEGRVYELGNQRYALFVSDTVAFTVGQNVIVTLGFQNAVEGGSAAYLISWRNA
jgi:hypothetical protein